MRDILFLIGRNVLGLFYLYSAWHHFEDRDILTQAARRKHLPLPGLAILGTGLILLLGGLSIILGVLPYVGIALVLLFLVPIAFLMHDFWAVEDPKLRANQKNHFLKNIALAASALMFVVISQPWPLSLGR